MRVLLLLSIAFGVMSLGGCSDAQETVPTASSPDPVGDDPADQPPDGITAEMVIDGLSAPVFVASPPGDTSRLMIVEQGGRIRLLRSGGLVQAPFLDISDRVGGASGERGLLGLAFHPNHTQNGFFYVNYTNASGATVISRFETSPGGNAADASSETVILTVPQPFSNHNAGMLAFGPKDGYLYVGLGDGGSGGDPQNLAQNPQSLLGKMLRLDVDGGQPYAIPDDNPYINNADTLAEIWSMGLRNPWRYSFDRLTGDLYIGDVGQSSAEEINYRPASSGGKENYGWRLKEGTACFNPAQNCDGGLDLTDPVYEYFHSAPSSPCSVTGGYVYRGQAIASLAGHYFFGDFCSGQIWSFVVSQQGVTDFIDRTAELGLGGISVSSFGEDARGELYVVDYGGTVYKIIPSN